MTCPSTQTHLANRPTARRSLARAVVSLALCCLLLSPPGARADDAVTPGKLTVDPPTLICLGVHWAVTGDDDGDATCRIDFRPVPRAVSPACRAGRE